MSVIQRVFHCEKCIHNEVCKYTKDIEEVFFQMEDTLNNITGDEDNLLVFTASCKKGRADIY